MVQPGSLTSLAKATEHVLLASHHLLHQGPNLRLSQLVGGVWSQQKHRDILLNTLPSVALAGSTSPEHTNKEMPYYHVILSQLHMADFHKNQFNMRVKHPADEQRKPVLF